MLEDCDIKRLVLNPGDTLVVKVKGRMSRDGANRFRQYIKALVPFDNAVLVLDDNVELSVIGAEPKC